MTKEELDTLKREHNKLHAEGCELMERIEVLFDEVMRLRKEIEAADPNDYDPIRLLFAGGFDVDATETDPALEAEIEAAEFAEAERQIQTGGF